MGLVKKKACSIRMGRLTHDKRATGDGNVFPNGPVFVKGFIFSV